MEQKAIQLGAVLLTLAFLLRLAGTRGNEEIGRTLLLLSSGRMVTQIAAPETQPEETRQEDPADRPQPFRCLERVRKRWCRSMPPGRWIP